MVTDKTIPQKENALYTRLPPVREEKSQTEIRRVTVRIRLIIKDFILTIRFQFLERVDILQDLRAMRHI